MEKKLTTELFRMAPEGGCGCNDTVSGNAEEAPDAKKILNVELMVIDLTSCVRCVPTGGQLKQAFGPRAPVAEALGIELKHREIVVQTPQEAKALGFLSSPTIRLNGRDIAQDIRESCGDRTENNTLVDCREWHYRGKVYSAAPLPLLIEAIMAGMLDIDTPPVTPEPIAELPESLQRYFDHKRPAARCC